MNEEELEKFAETIVERSTKIEEGDYVYLSTYSTETLPLFEKVRNKIIEKGAFPHEHLLYDSQLGRAGMDYEWITKASDKQLSEVSGAKKKELEQMDAYICITGRENENELNGADPEKISLRKQETKELAEIRRDMKWSLVTYPTNGKAQKAGMPTQKFTEFFFDAANIDWEKLEQKNEKIKQKFDGGQEVRITSENTDLRFSIKGRKGVPCNGEKNLPDGEVFYTPVKESVEGHIQFTYPGRKQGNEVTEVYLELEDGKVVEFSAEKNEDFLREQLNTDEGARYFGEFGIGTNWQIDRFTNELALDEKIGGTIHLALGSAFPQAVPEEVEPNDSSIHWDIVKDLRKQEGDGGKIILDDEVVQEGGEWQF
ncbi:aminopeptidase [Candidatus Nanohalobium constans]|uniref:Leucyl aminopeptidase (Aminopeptidase T) n=1 Tax=Candidatus Nanohalobium constans TaxID=2565781 RepID=A0A5Q0UEF5_9ARCH|nr:aminopeptidase [Candidatus Nanohalobium constans]QGA79942.1 leucyl aminopeptidase (aminopeptidase T) [Candidatus Nanohalobium constans]